MTPELIPFQPKYRRWLFLSAWVVPAGELVGVRFSGMPQKSLKPLTVPVWGPSPLPNNG